MTGVQTCALPIFKRLCVALSAFNNPSQPIIDERIVQWVANWTVFHLEKLLERLEINGIDEDVGINEEILSIIHSTGTSGATSRDIVRRHRGFKRLDAIQKMELLEKLLANAQIIEQKEGKAVRFFMPVFFKKDCKATSK